MIKAIVFDCFGVLTTEEGKQVLDYIRELHKRGYRIGLLSNVASNWIRDSFLTPEEQRLFDEMILSFETGITKSDPRMFQLTCERLHTTPEETILIDDAERYGNVARAEGWQAIVYDNFKQMKQELEQLLKDQTNP